MKVKRLKIERAYLPDGTFGDLSVDDVYFSHTIEPPWRNNEKSLSCIQEGLYWLIPHVSPKYGKCFIVVNQALGVVVSHDEGLRWGILFHPANWPYQLHGCIAPVKQLMVLGGKYGGNRSRETTEKLFELLGDEEHQLEIITKTICIE